MNTLFQDLRFAVRQLRKHPGFALAAIVTLALGIGANTAIFSVVYALLLKPLPDATPERLVVLHSENATRSATHQGVAPATLADLGAAVSPAFEVIAGSLYDYGNLTGVPAPTQVTVGTVTAEYFRVLGVAPSLGRTFGADDCRSASAPTTVLGHKLWQTQFGGDAGIIGRAISLGGVQRTVIGVMPAGFKDPANVAEAWWPIPTDSPEMQVRANRYMSVIARLAPGGSLEGARATLSVASENFARAYPTENTGWTLSVAPLVEETVSDSRLALLLLLGAVGGVLGITCVNVANLQLLRAVARRRELGVRLALGAGRWRIARQLLTESLLLAAIGGGLGVLLAAWGLDGIIALLPAGYSPRQEEIALSGPVLAFTAGVALLTGIAFGLLPAWFAGRQEPTAVLHGGSRGASEGREGTRARGALVVAQVALATVLLTGAGLVMRSFLGVLRVPAGLRTERVLTLGLSLSETRYGDVAKRGEFYRQVLERARAVPGVAAVGLASTVPFNWTLSYAFTLDGQTTGDPTLATQNVNFDCVNPEFFPTLDVPLRTGRLLRGTDVAGAPGAAVVNASFARRWFPGVDPLGHKVTFPTFRTPLTFEIVGVVADMRRAGLEKEAPSEVYVPYAQRPTTFATLFVRADAGLPAETLTRPVQAAIWSLDAEQPVTNVSTLARAVTNSVAPMRMYFLLFAGFAGLALGLAALGLYGTVAFAVAQRTREIGIRVALGAARGDVVRLVLGSGLGLAAAGLALGVAAALGLTRLMGGLLYGVAPRDPLTFAGVVALLGTVALLANLLPTRRALRISPTAALREE